MWPWLDIELAGVARTFVREVLGVPLLPPTYACSHMLGICLNLGPSENGALQSVGCVYGPSGPDLGQLRHAATVGSCDGDSGAQGFGSWGQKWAQVPALPVAQHLPSWGR